MPTSTGARIPCLVALALIGFLELNPLQAQEKLPFPKAAPTAPPAIPEESPSSAQVFPEGGFPSGPMVAEGGIPESAAKPGATYPGARYPVAEYAPPGLAPREEQETPGAEYYRPNYAPLLPAYVYQQAYYERPVISPHSVSEYAPPGYEARDQQDGPGVPEFTPITPPPRTTPEERQRFVTAGMMPGSFLVPGTNTSFRLRGFVRLTALNDFDPIGTPDIFVTNSIPVPQSIGQNSNMTARPSRFALESWTPTDFQEWNIHTFVEGDFFNGAGQAAGGGGNPFRLRHAFVDFGYFRVGQQNTVFMDANTWANVVDFQGPAGWVNQRRPGARMTLPITDEWFWAVGVEQPFSDITIPATGIPAAPIGSAVQDVPDFATHLRYEGNQGHVQLSGIARAIGYRPLFGEVTRRTGCGASVGTTFHPWAILIHSDPTRKANPSAMERCRIIGQYTAGWGIGRYTLDTVGLGLDGQVNPVNGGFDLPFLSSFVLSYEHWYTERWLSALTWSETHVGSNENQPGTTYVGAKYVSANLWYIPFRNMSIGVEYLWGERENLNDQSGRARRLNGLVQYNF